MLFWPQAIIGVFYVVLASDVEEDSEVAVSVPGLVAEFQQAGKSVYRIDENLQFHWRDQPPDARLEAGPFHAKWTGTVRVLPGGEYRFTVWVQGRVKVQVAGQTVCEGESTDEPRVIEGPPIRLNFGPQPIEVYFEKSGTNARCKLYWSSASFEREPIPATAFSHEAHANADAATRGEELSLALRCGHCHDVGLPKIPAPSLAAMQGTISADWLREFLAPTSENFNRHSPDFGLKSDEADALVAFLLSDGPTRKWNSRQPGDPKAGRSLFERVGCLACHRIGDIGSADRFGGPDLTRIASKRPTGYFSAWLTNPASLNSRHRMPVFELKDKEVADIAAYLGSLGAMPFKVAVTSWPEQEELGRELFARLRCAQCHQRRGFSVAQAIPLSIAALETMPISEPSPSGRGKGEGSACWNIPDRSSGRPGYRLSEEETTAIREFLRGRPSNQNASIEREGKNALMIQNCRSCHARGVELGLRQVVAELGKVDRKEQAALVPPALDSVGAKLNQEWLQKAVRGETPRQRPWLAPRMPKFHFANDADARIVGHFVARDELPPTSSAPSELASEDVMQSARRLVGSAGFGCMSCHAVGGVEPINVEAGARGPNLKNLDDRIRYDWFRRWTRNPNRIAPGVEMPGVNLASPGVLDGNVETQLQALWQGLNEPTFEPPAQNAVQSLTAIGASRPIVLRDIFEHAENDHSTRPLAVGFPNGHSLLVDLNRFAFRRWWFGDFASEYTRGKTWYWQTSGVTLWDGREELSLVAIRRDGKIEMPIADGQSIARLDAWRRIEDQIHVRSRLRFPSEIVLDVELVFKPIDDGIQATVSIVDPPTGVDAVLLRDGDVIRLAPMSIESPLGPVFLPDNLVGEVVDVNEVKAVAVSLSQPVDLVWKFARPVEPVSSIPRIASTPQLRKVLPAIPGYDVVRLPLPANVMPTAMACRTDGTVLVTSLKGGVFVARDSDGDDELDSYQPFFDGLASPFGIVANEKEVLVGHKHELLRLLDDDRDDFCERAEVVSTGWGVTFDYHDWMVGPVPDGQGNWLLALSCQQDKRSQAESLGRGKLIRTRPDRGFDIQCEGLRFPMGLIRTKDGEVFATDNQGVTNPFNELNHLQTGRHYGFFSALEERAEGQVTEPAAIEIPHPWSGSVNGLAVIPEDGSFGPFGGHLIGAEYTTKRLIRMSLQQVGDTYQGCVYPFGEADRAMIERDDAFLGPISLCFSGNGTLYVGSMIDSGWGGGNNRGAIEQVRFTGKLPLGIREVRAWSGGFDVDFTQPVDQRFADPKFYRVSSFRRVPAGGYATPDSDRAEAMISKVGTLPGGGVRLHLGTMRAGFVHEISVISSTDGQKSPYPAVAYYTLLRIP